MKDFEPIVSVMIPVYNGEKTLPLALSSLLIQTYPNWQAIIVNDGSTDGTKEYLNSLKDPRFKVIHFEKNRGRPHARQASLEAAEGKYLAFLDADDFYHPENLQKQIGYMEENPNVDLVSCGNASYDSGFNLRTVRGQGKNEKILFKIGDGNPCTLRTSIVRLEKAKKIKFNNRLKKAQDNDFIERYLNGSLFLKTEFVLYFYSEFVSVNKKKIISTYYFGIIRRLSLIKYAPLKVSVSLVKHILRGVIVLMISPFVSVDFFLKRRGAEPSVKMKKEFFSVLERLEILCHQNVLHT